MLSASYHICYWILSIAAAAVYQGMAVGLGYGEDIFRKSLIPLMAFALYIIWSGPRHHSTSWHAYQKAATVCLMACLGAVTKFVYIPGGSAKPLKEIVHVLLAFSAIGTLESIRQNRKDIEPAVFSGLAAYLSIGIKLVGWRGLVASCYSRLFACWILHGICLVVDHVLASIYGPGVSSQSVKTAHMNSTLEHLSSSIVILYALGPLEDVAETVFYQVHRLVYPKLVPKPSPLVGPNQPWLLLRSNAVRSFSQWVFSCLFACLWKLLAGGKYLARYSGVGFGL